MRCVHTAVLAEARDWIGTPYVHQAAAKGAGCDCLGLLRGIWRAIYGAEPETPPAYTADWSEASRQERLWEAARAHLIQDPPEVETGGQILLFRMRDQGVAKHLGVVGNTDQRPSFVHAYSGHGVIESPLSTPWRRRIVARFSFPERGI